ncbi:MULTISPECIES: hypothetical protein [unclassified Mesorhizobium]|uniref:hypothetical protein n=1 Tax=unclassified Mesorhizobium TaxID=325217 RepID=UPI000FD98629|nr:MULTISPECIES: hypothetical protein [unclassified Mesorhizobium]TGQ16367.1 hypothetical protein EN862_002390 [Mesorhizobium sp. M2E.F.Ca.ET.219.01.1.1]TGT77536.1 hypothetical protein EN809_008170 [Mesorhizobium sp. M2E.F.Ca.ET.166.01.1.1]TGW03645.1 hypothetical protein EN797_008170 [Mesorhizobium sp. M2E.F.Ca.ET.154.01.1.1]
MKGSFLDALVDSRLDDALMQALGGRPLITRARRPNTVKRLFARAAEGQAMLETVPIDVSPTRSAQHALLEAVADIAPIATNLGALCTCRQLSYKLLIADLRGYDAAPWLMLAGTFASERAKAEDGPALALIVDSAIVPGGCDLLDDGVFVGPPEAAVFARERRQAPGLIAECGDAAAIEVSRGDLTQLGAMLDLSDRDRFDPSGWVRQQLNIDAAKLPWRGKEEVCATWLAKNAPARLTHRVWRGHVSVMFPWLAEALSAFLHKHASELPTTVPDKHAGNPIRREDFEWGDIVYALSGRHQTQADRAHRIRLVRNSLAHRRPLSWQDACRAKQDVEALLAWT